MAWKDTVTFAGPGTNILRQAPKIAAKLSGMAFRKTQALAFVGLSAALVPACLPDAKGDYDKFVTATESQREKVGGGGIGDASIDASVEAVDGTYFGICYSSLAADSLSRTLRFYVDVKIEPIGAGGKAKLVLSPMRADALKFDRTLTTTPPLVYDNVEISSAARFSSTLGVVAINGAANPLTGRDIELKDVTLDGLLFSKPEFCSGFAGDITKPLQQPFTAICRYFAMKDGESFSFKDDEVAGLPGASMTIPSLNKTFTSKDFKSCPPTTP